VFPGVFRGLLDAASTSIDEDVMLAAAKALSEVVHPDELNPAYIIPSVFHPDVSSVVAAAVRAAALGLSPEAAERAMIAVRGSGSRSEAELVGE
jgi:malate dehydrogenase (oxaloacetate-decarboxylating)